MKNKTPEQKRLEEMAENALQLLIDRAGVDAGFLHKRWTQGYGGLTELGKILGVTRQAIGQWKRLPDNKEYLKKIKKIYGLTKQDLRPDVYGDPKRKKKVGYE